MKWDERAPGEDEAQHRTWEVVRNAWAERERVPRPRPSRIRVIVPVAAALAIVAAAFSPPGTAVLHSIRNAVRGERNASAALFALPGGGRLLVQSDRGVWVVQPDGSKRLLRGYRDPSWSPHGKFIAAVNGHEVRALEPNGAVHWSLARAGTIRFPSWSDATPPCCRIAYLAGNELRVVNGNGTGDRFVLGGAHVVPPVWQPHTHNVAFVNEQGNIEIADGDNPMRTSVIRIPFPPHALEWTPNGRGLLALQSYGASFYAPRGFPKWAFDTGTTKTPFAAISPDSRKVAIVESGNGKTTVTTNATSGRVSRQLFAGPGAFGAVGWSPNAHWLLLDWDSADQWLFVPVSGSKRIHAVGHITANFGRNATPAGWCCP